RELCGVYPNYFNLASVTDGFDDCLPNRLKKLGYSTSAIHGAVGTMYDRVRWYPRAGFEIMTFYESREWAGRCYSFPGACDIEIFQVVKEQLSVEGKLFVYWLTLNSHSTYDLRDVSKYVFDCRAYEVAEDTQSCRNLKLQAQFF